MITTLGYGGAERLLLDFMRYADRQAFDYEVISMVRGGELEKDFKRLGVPLEILYKKTKLGIGIFFKLYNHFKKQKPDIVHTHLFGADLWAGFAAYFAGVPVIVKTEHNVNLQEGFVKKFTKRLTKFVFKKLVAVSPSVAEYMVMTEKMPKDKIRVIYNGIDLQRFNPKEGRAFSSPPVLINISRFEEQKGHKYLVEALKKIEQLPWILWLVGEGSLRSDIEKRVADLGLAKRVKFLGQREDIPNLLSQSDIFVFPSLWEGLGIAALEAGAVGLPIVATNVTGIRDIFEDNKNAKLVDAKDARGFAEAVGWCLEHPSEALFLGAEARELVCKEFSIQAMVQKYEIMYKNALSIR